MKFNFFAGVLKFPSMAVGWEYNDLAQTFVIYLGFAIIGIEWTTKEQEDKFNDIWRE